MNMFDEDDKKIEAILKADIYEPESYTNAIANALKKKNKRKIFVFSKLIATIIAGAMLVSGVVYAKQIEEFILRFFNNSKGIDTAVKNGYIETVGMEFTSNSKNKVKIENLLIDDYNISFVLDFDLDTDLKNLSSLIIPDMLITDEFNNILLCKDKTKFEEYCMINNLNYDFSIFNEKYLNTTMFKNQTFNNNIISYNIKSTKPYPNFKELIIEFNNIILEMENGDSIYFTDEWKIKINILEEFYTRKSQVYNAIDANKQSIDITRFDVYNTGTIFEFNGKFNPYITDTMTEEQRKIKEELFIKWGSTRKHKEVEKIYITNEHGEKFYSTNSNQEDEEIAYFPDGSLHYKTTLDLTQYDMTDTLTLYLTIHTIDEDKDVVIKLKKSDE